MKTNEQIELANAMIKDLKDYIELARVEKKLSDEDRSTLIAEMISDAIQKLKTNIEEL